MSNKLKVVLAALAEQFLAAPSPATDAVLFVTTMTILVNGVTI